MIMLMRAACTVLATLVLGVSSHGSHYHHQHDASEQEHLHLRSPSRQRETPHHHHGTDAWLNDEANAKNASRHLASSKRKMKLCGAHSPSIEEKLYSAKIVHEWEEANGGLNRARKLASFTANVPVYFHVIQRDAVYGSLSDLHRDNMMAAINKGFAGTGFTFYHVATDIFINATYFNCAITRDIDNNLPIKQLLRKGGADAMNIYVCNTEASVSGNGYTTGWANTAPQTMQNLVGDGLFLTNPSTSIFSNPEVAYQTANHEVAHLMGLLHTFEGGCSTETYNHYQFKVTGDGVADTASHSGPTQNQAGYSSCWLTNPPLDTCSDSIVGIDPGVDPVKNYMNYIDSSCMAKHGEFTVGQISRMIAHWEAFRDTNRGITCGCHYVCTDAVLDTAITSTTTCRSKISQFLATMNELNACYNAALKFPAQCGVCNPVAAPCNVFVPAPAPSTSSPVSTAPFALSPTIAPPTGAPIAQPTSIAPVAAPVSMPVSVAPVMAAAPTLAPANPPQPVPTAAPTVKQPLSLSACADIVKSACGCKGTTTCKKRAIKQSCSPPQAAADEKTYINQVLKTLEGSCV